MTRIDQIIADALAGSPETHVAILAREVVRLREAPAVVAPELTDDGYKLAASRFASAGRTVIPPLTDDEIEERYRSLTNGTDELEREWCYKDCRWAYSLAVYRVRVAVAGSMLGTGMVAVDRRIIEKFTTGCHEWMPGLGRCGDQYPGGERQLCSKCTPLRDALRANQGGSDHD